MKDYITKNGAILGGFALVTTGLIALTNFFTAPKIAEAQERQLLSVLNQLVPPQMHNNDMHLDCLLVEDPVLLGTPTQKRVFRARQGAQSVALILETTTPNGYSGDIKMVVAVSVDGYSMGARVLDHKETPGLGDKIDLRVSDWILSFNNIDYSEENEQRWEVKKDGGKFDQFTGATITPRAVVEGVKNAVIYAQQNKDFLYDTRSNCPVSIERSEQLS
ncbi:electron transport complex subunit RsxG [Glaciecola sp. KUL10]|uniref:electron transport complex subunit RsxG n=1 Tax=Glaciecola sp. (strain KUL10) TaxID=2161813 RepID=UPI000D78C7FA|nr:electron transport complex subunit RsxG [Glaciecola sp. KUL10]GBL03463.1 RnfABCDGE type electron transport complex subunit G [Glaciecola sp. KUL10]